MAGSYFGSLVDSIVSKSFAMTLTAERQQQITDIGKYWDFYNGDQEQYIKQYEGEKNKEYEDKDKPTFNYTRAVVNEYINGVFAKPVKFKFASVPHQKAWDSVVDPLTFFKIVPFFGKCQRIAEVSNTCLVMIRHDKELMRPYFEDIRGEFVSFVPKENKPKEIGTLIISYHYDTGHPDPEKRILKRVEVWDNKQWEIWLYSPALKEEKLAASGPNPYGFIPAEKLCPEEDDNTFYGLTNTGDIVKVNEVYNNLWTALVRTSVFQSFSVMVIKSEGEIEVTVAPTRLLKLGDALEADAKYITPDPKIAEVASVLGDLKSELQNLARVPQEVMSSAKALTPDSGYALRIKRIPVEQEWEKRRMSYGPSIKSLAQKTVMVDAIQRGQGVSKEQIEVDVDFTSTIPPLAPQEQILTDEQHLRYNLITPVDLMIREDPTLTRDEAKKRIEFNRKELEQMGFNQFGGDKETEFERLKVRMGQKESSVKKAIAEGMET